jgi:hypothetical protein
MGWSIIGTVKNERLESSTVYTCDMCGTKSGSTWKVADLEVSIVNPDCVKLPTFTLDLCPQCQKKARKYIFRKGVK